MRRAVLSTTNAISRAASFLANATCKVFFNVADLDAARLISEMIGQTTSLAHNQGISHTNTDLMR